jgi:hypothetical protein
MFRVVHSAFGSRIRIRNTSRNYYYKFCMSFSWTRGLLSVTVNQMVLNEL